MNKKTILHFDFQENVKSLKTKTNPWASNGFYKSDTFLIWTDTDPNKYQI